MPLNQGSARSLPVLQAEKRAHSGTSWFDFHSSTDEWFIGRNRATFHTQLDKTANNKNNVIPQSYYRSLRILEKNQCFPLPSWWQAQGLSPLQKKQAMLLILNSNLQYHIKKNNYIFTLLAFSVGFKKLDSELSKHQHFCTHFTAGYMNLSSRPVFYSAGSENWVFNHNLERFNPTWHCIAGWRAEQSIPALPCGSQDRSRPGWTGLG